MIDSFRFGDPSIRGPEHLRALQACFGSVWDRDAKFSEGQVWKLYKYSGLHTEYIFAHVLEDLKFYSNITQGDV